MFRFYVRELALALTDLLEQSTHALRSVEHAHTVRLLRSGSRSHPNSRCSTRLRRQRVGLENVMISPSGRSLFLAKLDFGDAADPFKRYEQLTALTAVSTRHSLH